MRFVLFTFLLIFSTMSQANHWNKSESSVSAYGYTSKSRCSFNWNYSKANLSANFYGGYGLNNHHLSILMSATGSNGYSFSGSEYVQIQPGGSPPTNVYINTYANPLYKVTTGWWIWKKTVKKGKNFYIGATGWFRSDSGVASVGPTASSCLWSNLGSYTVNQVMANGTTD